MKINTIKKVYNKKVYNKKVYNKKVYNKKVRMGLYSRVNRWGRII